MITFGPYRGVVDLVHDGDTVNVRLDVGFDLTVYSRVRVLGINAPELSTAEGKAARDFARTLLPVGAPVSVVSYGWDKYGGRIDGQISFNFRTGSVASVTLADDFALAMIAAGHAVRWDGTGAKPV